MLKYICIIFSTYGGLILKNFYKKYSFAMVKLFVTQCVIGLFGNMLALFSASVQSVAVTVAAGIFSMLFYYFLIYITVWEIGSKDVPAIEGGRLKRSNMTGFYKKNQINKYL